MKKEKLIIEISNPHEHIYLVSTTSSKKREPSYRCATYVENVEGHFILKKETLNYRENIFGVTRKPEEADERLHGAAKDLAQELVNSYSPLFSTEIVDKTERGKVNQLEIDVKN